MISSFTAREYEHAAMADCGPGGGPEQARVSHQNPAGCESDELTVARLAGAAQRHAPLREPTEAETATAVAELREIAGARGDLLAEVAGLLMGFYRQTSEEPRARTAAHYCLTAGARPDLIPRWIEVGRCRAAAARQPPRAVQRARGDDLGASI